MRHERSTARQRHGSETNYGVDGVADALPRWATADLDGCGAGGKGSAVCLWLVVRHHRFTESFLEGDAGYLRWLAEHPGLFVLNTYRTPTPAYLILHRAGCRSITELPASGRHWTTDYRKVYGSRTELEQYAREKAGGHPKPCGHCL